MASDYLLEIDGIKGESSDSKHPGTIEIDSFNWSASNGGVSSVGSGAGSGKVSITDLTFATKTCKASPILFFSCATGKHIKKAQLFVRKQGGKQEDYYKVTMTDLIVSSFQSGGSSGGDSLPAEQFALNFTKIEFEYAPQKIDGSLETGIVKHWDLKLNKGG